MRQKIKMLMVDDHPFILQAYKNTLDLFKPAEYEMIYYDGIDGKTGYEVITNATTEYDIALFDISIPTYPEKNISSGIDLAILLKKTMPNCKIILLTMHDDKIKFKYLLDNLNPIGLIIKNDMDFNEFLNVMETIIEGNKYYSETILKMMEEENFI
jgi:DNA-binding NarL/FixJ family response regulator